MQNDFPDMSGRFVKQLSGCLVFTHDTDFANTHPAASSEAETGSPTLPSDINPSAQIAQTVPHASVSATTGTEHPELHIGMDIHDLIDVRSGTDTIPTVPSTSGSY